MQHKMRHVGRDDRGFSFIELLAYMASAALLILAAVPQFSNYRSLAHDHNVQNDLINFGSAMEGAYAADLAYPTNFAKVRALKVAVTRDSYDVTNNAMLLCAATEKYVIFVRSASGRVWQYTPSGGIAPAPDAFPTGMAIMCPMEGLPTTWAMWLHDVNVTPAGWQF